jgi:hypothetical protein
VAAVHHTLTHKQYIEYRERKIPCIKEIVMMIMIIIITARERQKVQQWQLKAR